MIEWIDVKKQIPPVRNEPTHGYDVREGTANGYSKAVLVYTPSNWERESEVAVAYYYHIDPTSDGSMWIYDTSDKPCVPTHWAEYNKPEAG